MNAVIYHAHDAAQDLLSALRCMVSDEGQHSAGCKGYSTGPPDESKCCVVSIARAAIAKATEARP